MKNYSAKALALLLVHIENHVLSRITDSVGSAEVLML